VALPKSFIQTVRERDRLGGERDLHSDFVADVDEQPQGTIIGSVISPEEDSEVHLRRHDNTVSYQCTCDAFRSSGRVCRHVWATLLSADQIGYLDSWDLEEGDSLAPEDSEDDALEEERGGPINERRIVTESKPLKRQADWKSHLANLQQAMLQSGARTVPPPVADLQILYMVDAVATLEGNGIALDLFTREKKKDGQWGKERVANISPETVARLTDASDREILSHLHGARAGYFGYYASTGVTRFYLREAQESQILMAACQTERCFLRTDPNADVPPLPMQWDDGPPWEFQLNVQLDQETGRYIVRGEVRREGLSMSLDDVQLMTHSGLIFTRTHIARFNDHDAFQWIIFLRRHKSLQVPAAHADELLKRLTDLPQLPPLELPEELRPEEVSPKPRMRLRIEQPRRTAYGSDRLIGHLSFDYDGAMIPMNDPGSGIYQSEPRRLLRRDAQAETAAVSLLLSLGFKLSYSSAAEETQELVLPPRLLPPLVRRLTELEWHVEADGKLYRQSGKVKIEVSSGIDWFELHGEADFGGQTVKLPKLLAALRKGEKTVVLGDGSLGVLPEQWLKQYGALAGMGTDEGDHLKFSRTQIGLLDALLAAQPEASCDEVFQQARKKVLEFSGVEPGDAPPGFIGTLRPYQRDGLGWMRFLRDFRFGGCLADDMGLGKTVQVLALLEDRRDLRPAEASTNGHGTKKGLSLVVVPRSLIFNWMEEAARFAPDLRVLDHTGVLRGKSPEAFAGYDLVLTTYGTLRNDIEMMRNIHFDYVILDEAQAIKNSATGSAKAVRLLQGDHRLALSGTPVQNHLGELWSLFEFLNPGMLGSARAFESAGAGARVVEQETREVLARALRPFILRRTKAQVASDLPARIEQTIHCELGPAQRKLYDELRDHYRQALMTRIEKEGMNKAKIQILEALLRLRQAACHPGLIDKKNRHLDSAKLDALLPQLAEVVDGNHKALVFSQFTSLLSIVRERLDKEKIVYEYLDGRTRDRAERVKRFQTDDNCKLFLISLKAGGLGLNLTAAEYVFLLDPWWNPAVEAQAIDRAHRIGQSRQVFAYRLIAKDTVEEKVVQLQATKRELADAILNADNSIISTIGKEELQLLLS
jgi:hypothetical protein